MTIDPIAAYSSRNYQQYLQQRQSGASITAPETEKPDPQTWDYRNATTGLQGETLPPGALGWRPDGDPDYGGGFSGWAKHAYYKVQDAYFKGWNEGQTIAEDKGYTSDMMPRFSSAIEATKAIGGELILGGVFRLLGSFAQNTEQLAGSVGFALKDIAYGGKTLEEINWKGNWEASRLAYNSALQGFTDKGDSLRQEFIERLNAGERPELIAEDMQIKGKANPWVEMGGQILFDPLNADLFVNWFGKGRKAVTLARVAQETFLTPENRVIGEVLDTAAKNADEATSAARFKEAFEAQRTLGRNVGEMVEVLGTPGGLKPLKGGTAIRELPPRIRQFAPLISDSRHAAISNRAGEVLSNIIRTVKDPDRVLDIMVGYSKLYGDNVDEAAEAFRFLMKQDNAGAIFSQAGNELGAVTARMFQKYGDDWIRAIDKAASEGGTEAVGELLMSRMNSTLDELFPSAVDMSKAYNAAKAGEALTPEAQRLAELGGRMRPIERGIAMMHDSAQRGIVGKANKLFVQVYMDWSPAFAFRNGTQNSMQIFLDYGPAAFIRSADAMFDDAARFHGAPLAGAEGYGAGRAITGGQKTVAEVGKTTGLGDALRAMFSKRSARAASEVFETNGARRIVGHTYVQTFKQGVKPLIASIAKDARFRDVPPEVWGRVESALYNNYGDIDKAMDVIRAEYSAGAINLFRDTGNVPKGLMDFMTRSGKEREFVDTVLNAGTKEEAAAALDKIFADLDTASQAVYVESRFAIAGDPMDDFLKLLEKDGLETDSVGRVISMQRQVNNETMAVGAEVVMKIDELVPGSPVITQLKKTHQLAPLMEWGAGTSNQLAQKLEIVRDVVGSVTDGNIYQKWSAIASVLGLDPLRVPANAKEFKDVVWRAYKSLQSETWNAARTTSLTNIPKYMDDVEKATGVKLPPALRAQVDDAIQTAEKWANVRVGDMGVVYSEPAALVGTQRTQIAQLAQRYGIASASPSGVPQDQHLLRIINKYGNTNFESLDDPILMDMVERAFKAKAGVVDETTRVAGEAVEQAAESAAKAEPLVPPYQQGTVPSFARGLFEGNATEVKRHLADYVNDNFGRVRHVATDPNVERAIEEAAPRLRKGIEEVRTVASRVAQENRNFTLLNYGQRTYMDVATAYLFPYGFWYKGTYNNWIQRVVQNPAVIAGYGKYKRALEIQNAGLPDWWKQNIKIDNVLGIDLENPLYFNLEATLNPLNGITGEDFNDPAKRVDWWSYTLDQVGKYGPSTWTPLNMVTGLALRSQGDQEAADSWLGRLIPQTALVKTWTGKEFDPLVGWMQGGYDKYERRRIGRALAEIVQDNPELREAAVEAGRTQSGDLWEQAVKLSNSHRQLGQTLSSVFGVGFKARTEEDMQIDRFDSEYRYVMTMKRGGYYDSDKFREQMAALSEKYPFMDTVLLSRRTGPDRDTAYVYNVFGRLPPGELGPLLETVGVTQDVIERFYNDKGDMTGWTEGDRDRMMAAAVDLGAILKIPDYATKQEWNDARSQYSDMRDAIESQLGEGVWDVVNAYYDAASDGKGEEFKNANPEVQQALDLKNEYVATNPRLNAYYGGLDTIQSYYEGKARAELQAKYGKNIYELSNQYYDILDSKERKSFLRDHPELKDFFAERKIWQEWVNQSVVRLASSMPERPDVALREDLSSDTQAALAEKLNAPKTVPPEVLLQEMSPALQQLIQLYWQSGEKLPYAATQQLDYIGERYGLSSNDILQILGIGQ